VDDADVWEIPAEVFKGKRPHLVPLATEALTVLEMLPRAGEYVFPSRADADAPHMSSTGPALRRIRKRTDKQGVSHWVAHDFRTTFRTHATRPDSPDHPRDPAGLGIAPEIADAVLGHKEQSIGFTHYTGEPERYRLAEKRDALRRWGAWVAEVVRDDA
jgi:integrase